MSHSHARSLLGRPVTIAGLGIYVPENMVTNDDLATSLETSDEWIKQRTGIGARRIAAPHEATSDLATHAARAALEDAGVDPAEIDLVITATVSPDHLTPATASRVAHNCGCVNAGAFDLSAGCAGFVFGLSMATGAIAAGVRDKVLVVGAEAISRLIDWEDRSTAILFGDGAGAAIVSPVSGGGVAGAAGAAGGADADRRPATGILGFDLGGDGAGADALIVPAGGSRFPSSLETVENRQHYLKMSGKEVYKFATRVVATSVTRVLDRCGYEVDDIDLFVPHQANLRILEGAVDKLGLPREKVYTNLQRYGNTSSASIPLCLCEARAEGRLRDGDLVLLMGFGAGLSWGACLMRWGTGAARPAE